MPDRFGQKLIESRSIFENNPYETENQHPETGIYVERNSLLIQLFVEKNLMLYTYTRRIGKSSLLKHLKMNIILARVIVKLYVSVAKVRNIDFKISLRLVLRF